ncbi:MAG: alpha/beta hydrolase [Merismopedia sp. SIO2A8]|nr:alpha/beta hydrolase [Symploca sp. SIO2B6]NET53302.1 alpha/beta hydrolase [Merismopedia sp. SIO2A8]
MEIDSYHPFRSPEAKERFLTIYDARAQKWPIPSETTIVETSYGQTFVRISGPGEGSPVVLLHGYSENSLNWLPNIEDLSQSYRTYAIDTICDPGRSVYTKLLKSADDFTTWLDELFDGLGLDRGINLIGLSYGGWLTSQYALRFPQRLNKIVFMAPGGIAPFSWKFITFGMLLSAFQFRSEYLFKRFTRWMFEDFLELHENGETEFDEWFNFLYLGMQCHKRQPVVFTKVLTDEELSRLQMPTLFLVGENEIIYSVEKTIARLQKVAPNIQIKVIKNAGHDLPMVQPQKVNLAMLDFLEEVSR